MNVSLAVELLPGNCQTCIILYDQGLLQSKDWEETSQFIKFVDSRFNLFNSETLSGNKILRDAYYCHLGVNLHFEKNNKQK